MASTDTVIAALSDAAQNSAEFTVSAETGPVYAYVYPYASLTAAEYANLERKNPAGTFEDVYDPAFNGTGGVVKLGLDTATGVLVTAPGTYRIAIDNPTNSVGAAIRASTETTAG